MKCQDFREVIDSYLSDELLTETNHGILSHLEGCGNCRGEIEARREIRGRLKTAVISAPEYQIDSGFADGLQSLLKRTPMSEARAKGKFLTRNSWIAVAASVLLVFTLGFLLTNQFGGTGSDLVSTPSVGSLQRNDLVNIALGDHEHCAIRHQLEESPVSLEQASAKYRGLDKIVVPSVQKVLAKYELVEAHACKYKDTKFAHLVLKGEGKTMSVVMTDLENGDDVRNADILKFASSDSKYQIARFDTDSHAIFVISDLDRRKNTEALEALSDPLRRHFGEQFQTTLLTHF